MASRIKKISTLILLLACWTGFWSGCKHSWNPRPQVSHRPPNIVLIFCDDLGYGDLGCYGSTKIRTPYLDLMAHQGVLLTQFYVTACVCTPSRAALMTGRYQIRSGLTRVLGPLNPGGIDDTEVTIGEVLRKRGYATAIIGKWHLGAQLPQLPTRHGFDYWFGIPYSNDMDDPKKKFPPTPLYRNEQIIERSPSMDTLTQRYTQEALGFIDRSKNKSFFLYLPYTMPHVPLGASQKFLGKSAQGLYGDVVEEIDWGVGEILKSLRRHNIESNTLVIFSSDNGPWLARKEHAGTAGLLRAGKMTVYEGGIRVPFIARWPGTIPPGTVNHEPAISLDLFPTFARLAGSSSERAPASDGVNLLKFLTEAEHRPPQPFYFYINEELRAIRLEQWKLHLPRPNQGNKGVVELYDLEADPGETRNLSAAHPEMVSRLLARAGEFDRTAKKTAKAPKRID